jgi:hypothetical protein
MAQREIVNYYKNWVVAPLRREAMIVLKKKIHVDMGLLIIVPFLKLYKLAMKDLHLFTDTMKESGYLCYDTSVH